MELVTEPKEGKLTWAAEGQEGGIYHSRKVHVPGPSSGITLGRGYDIKLKLKKQVIDDLVASGVQEETARKIAGGVGLSGSAAKEYLKNNSLLDFEISVQTQAALFGISYLSEASEAKRISTKADVVKAYGKTDWGALHPAIRETVVDMKFRGDYTPSARKVIQKHIAENDLSGFAEVMAKRELWSTVPKDRFNRRKDYLADAVEKERKQNVPRHIRIPRLPPGLQCFPP